MPFSRTSASEKHNHPPKVLSRPLSDRFNQALVYAAKLHRLQTRKGRDIPYLGHLLGVASLVLESGGDEEMTIAALLHDAVEDQGGRPRLQEIRTTFGERVAHIVEGCTDSDAEDPARKAPWCERKQRYIHHVEHEADPEVRLVSLADKVHNARAILLDFFEIGDTVFDRFSGRKQGTLWYYRALMDAFRAAEARKASHDSMEHSRLRLMGELERILTELEHRAGGPGVNPCRG